MIDDEERLERMEDVWRRSRARVERLVERARKQETRTAILDMLAEDGGRAELSAKVIAGRLHGKRRGNVRQARYHLDILHTAGLVLHDGGGDAPLYRLV